MDLQEKEEFNAYFKEKYPELYKDVFDPDGDERAILGYSFAWSAWQAKAQADQKVKLLLCDEHLKKCESPTGIFNSQYPDEEPCLICLAKEAKAQAVPEGYVLMPIKPTETMVMAVVKEHEGDAFLPYSLYDAYVKQAMLEAQELANESE